MKVLLLAAGRGRRFGKRTARLPKCLIPLGKGANLLSRYLDSFRKLDIRKIVIVVGHEKKKIMAECARKGRGLDIRFIANRRYRLGSIVSLASAAPEMNDDCLIMDADVFFSSSALKSLLRARKSSFLLDPRSKSSGEEMMLMSKDSRPVKISKKTDPSLKVLGEATGFFLVKKKDARRLAGILRRMVRAGKTKVEYEGSYCELMKKSRVGYVKIKSFWTEMDLEGDLKTIRGRLKS